MSPSRPRDDGRGVAHEEREVAARGAQLAAELVGLKPDLIVTTSGEPSAAVKSATSTIPIVAVAIGDPVRSGLVASLARPGGNLTGLANLVSEEFSGKMLEKLHQAVPAAARVVVLWNTNNADHPRVLSSDLPPAARRLGVTLVPVEVKSASVNRSPLALRIKSISIDLWRLSVFSNPCHCCSNRQTAERT